MRGHVTERAPGVWRVFVDAGADPLTGRRRRITKTFHGTKKGAETFCAQLVADTSRGHGPAAGRTVGELLERWYDAGEIRWSPTTANGYRSKIDLYLLPAFKELPLKKLTTERLDDFYRELLRRGGRSRKKDAADVRTPLSANTVLGVHRIIHAACEQARRWAWLDRNPAELTERPSVDEDEIEPPDGAALVHLVSTLRAEDRDFADLVQTAIATGLRRGQICALRWTDFNLDAGTATISRRAIVEHRGGRLEEVGGNRNKRRKARAISIDKATLAMLRARRLRQAERTMACGAKMPRDAFVFAPEPPGDVPLAPQYVTSRWVRLSERFGVDCRFHDLRHFANTHLLSKGVPVRDVAGRHGYASARMVLDVYGHAQPAGDLAAAEILGELLEQIAG